MPNVLGNFPSINELLDSPPLKSLVERVNPTRVMSGVRSFVDGMRQELQTAVKDRQIPSPVALAEQIAQWIMRQEQTGVRSVINATGTVLHHDLGGPPLAEEALLALRNAGVSYTGATAGSSARVEQLLRELTGCEAALVVNNVPAALSLATCCLANDRQVLLPLGQMGTNAHGLRAHDLIASAGGCPRPVGSVNEVTPEDFTSAAHGEETGFAIWQEGLPFQVSSDAMGLTSTQLGAWSREQGVPLVVDLGHGGLLDGVAQGFPAQPTIATALQSGASVVIARGDGLLGGPSCAIVVGRSAQLRQLMSNPLLNTIACNKLTLAALEATLSLYQAAKNDPANSIERSVPLWGLLAASTDNLKHRVERLAPQLATSPVLAAVEPRSGLVSLCGSKIGSVQLTTWSLALKPTTGTAAELLNVLAAGTPAVVGRLEGDRVILDLRAVSPREDQQIVQAVEQLGSRPATAAT